jgi:hypothetical protein
MAYKDRFEIEQELAEGISEALQDDYYYLNMLEEPDEEFWEKERKALEKAILPILIGVLYFGMETFVDSPSVPEINLDDIMSSAQDWARSYTYELVSGLTQRSASALQAAFGDFFAGTIGEDALKEKIAYWFSPYRAETIAITEVTRALEKAKEFVSDRILVMFPELDKEEIWRTAQDERVCPICGPLEGTRRYTAWYDLPPIHPRGRCTVEIRFVRR